MMAMTMTDQLHLPTGTYFRREIDTGPGEKRERPSISAHFANPTSAVVPKVASYWCSRNVAWSPERTNHGITCPWSRAICRGSLHSHGLLPPFCSSSSYRYQLDYAELCKRSAALTGYSIPTEDNRLYKNGGNGKGSRAASIEK